MRGHGAAHFCHIYNCRDFTFLTKIWGEIVIFFVGGSGVDGKLVGSGPRGGVEWGGECREAVK